MVSKSVNFSIIIPCYNAYAFVGKAIDSALIQARDDFEVIVIDDGSKDKTLEILELYASKNKACVRCFHQGNKGPGAARNTGVRIAKGKYLYFLDADDQMCNEALDIFDRAIKKNDKCDYVYAGHYSVNLAGKTKLLCPKPSAVDNLRDFKRLIAGRGVSPTIGSTVIHRDCFNKLSYPEEIRCNEDFVLFAHLFALYKGRSLSDPVVYKYKRPGSLRTEKQAIIDALEKAPGLLFDPSTLPVEFFRLKSLYLAKRYLEKARIHFKNKEFSEFRKTFHQAVRVYPRVLFKPRFLTRYMRSYIKFF